MAKMTFDAGIYTKKLEQLGKNITSISKAAIYDAAGIVTKAIEDEIRALPTLQTAKQDYAKGTEQKPINGVTNAQKEGLLEGLGIAAMEDDGSTVNTKIGFDGYNSVRTKKYPQGQPHAMIARAVNSGTSFRKKNRFVARAVQKSKEKAEAAIAERLESAIAKSMQ